MPGFGHNSFLGFGEETVWGTAVPADRWVWIDNGGDNANQTQNWIDTKAVGLLGTAFDMSFQGTKDARGDFSFEMPYQGVERLLKHALGQSWFTSNPYVDGVTNRFTFDVNDDLTEMKHGAGLSGKKGLTFKMRRDLQTFVYNGAKINTIEFSMAKDKNLRCKLGFIGKGYDDEANAGTPSPNNQGFFNYYQGVLKYTSVDAGTVFVPLEAWSLTLNNNLDEDRYLFSGKDRKEPVRKGKIEVIQKFTAEFDNTSAPINKNTLLLFNDFKNSKVGSTEMIFTGKNIPGSASKPFKLQFFSATDQHQARVRQYPVKVENEGRIRFEGEIKSYRDAAETAPSLANSRRELRIICENAALASDQ